MRYDFEFNKFQENYPVEVDNKMRHRFIELCNTILYSDNQQLVNRCYDTIFSDYRGYILSGHPVIKCSQFEEVILKILNDEENSTMYTEHGITTTPFMRYLALIKESDMSNMSYKFKAQNNKFKDSSKITEVSHGLKYSFFVYFYCITLHKKLYDFSYKIGKSCTIFRTS